MFQAAAKVAVFSVCLLAVTFPATAQSNYQVTGTVKWSVSLKAGRYTFRSDRHPKLRGSFVVAR